MSGKITGNHSTPQGGLSRSLTAVRRGAADQAVKLVKLVKLAKPGAKPTPNALFGLIDAAKRR